VKGRHETVLGGVGPRSTPTIRDGVVYSHGATGWLHAIDGATGNVLWKKNVLDELGIDPVGTGFLRALYATYLSYLPTSDFAYPITRHVDPRGAFAEMLRTRDSGQFSFFTAHPGITRGGHYHHTKNEKFLVVSGRARFGFRHVVTGEAFTLETCGDAPQVVDTVPGWAHDITNIGDTELVVLLWANELFDKSRPDTITHKV
jgi:UDP-2-acetamido-2,6-beta-L-arabino-hexul-4-ose reductase